MSESILKYHKLISVCIGLLFLLVVQNFSVPVPIFRFLLPAVLCYLILVAAYNRWYLIQNKKYNFWALLLPELLIAAGFGAFLVIPSANLRGLFISAAVVFIALGEIVLGNMSENLMLNQALVIAFGLFFGFFGAYFYTPSYEIIYLIGVFLGAGLLARAFYESVPQPEKTKLIGAVAIGLFCAELFWVLNFLNFHFSVLSLILFNIFYFCLIMNYYHLFHNLNFKKVQFHLLLIAFCSFVVLLATPWSVRP
jgi:hypothetical protein